ncbi:MAG: MBG domain-containing protein [Thiotrichaceae bacterium]|nr:MBG domain-containing protein [Thiotrichaceae bacterium]
MFPIRPPRVNVIEKLLFKILFPSLLSMLFISNSYAAATKLLIAGYMANPASTDSQYEYIQLLALETIDFSTTPYAVVFTNNGTAKSSGWITGAGLTYGFNITSGTIQAGEFAYVGGAGKLINGSGSTDISGAKWLRTIDNSNNAGDRFGNKNASGVLGNGGTNADGFAVFDMDISNITASTIPIDAVFFGSTVGTAKPASGGYTLPTNDHYDSAQGTFGNGTNTYLFPVPKSGYFVKLLGNYNQATTTWTTSRSSTEQSISSTAALSELDPELQVDFAPTLPSVLPQNITAFNPPSSATYGDKVINLTATGGGSNNPLIFASSTPEICSVTDSSLKILAAGDCKISVNQAGNTSYEAASELSKTILVHKKSISAKIDNKNRAFGEVNPIFTISYTGLIENNIETPPTFNSSANASSPVGNYLIVCDNSGSSAKNYVIETCENGVLNVEKSSPVISLSQTANYVIFGNALTVKFTATGLPTGEVTVSDGVNSCHASLAVGMCNLIPSSSGVKILTATYASDSNYSAASQTQELKVTQVIFSRDNLTLTEGANDSYSVKLASQPAENITLSITQKSQITTNPTSLIFTPTNWNTPQIVKLAAVDDTQNQGNRRLNLEHKINAGDGAGYPDNLAIPSIKIAITDNDTPAVAYVAPSYKLTLQTSGAGKGILTGTQAGIYSQGSTITLTASPDNNSEFKAWQPQTCASTFNINADTTCTAQFDLKPAPVVAKPQVIPQVTYYQFTAQTSGTGKGIISGTASGKYAEGSNIQLSVTPDINSVFIAWTPATCAQNFSLNADQICTAQFDLKPPPVVVKAAPIVENLATVLEKQIISKPVLKSENIAPIIQTNEKIGNINADNNPCFFNKLLNTLCNAAQVKTNITEITANGQLSNTVIDAPLLNQGWVSDSSVTTKGEITGGIITGYIENQGIIRDIDFKGRYLKGGILAGKIRNSSAEGYLENVTFAADSSLNGGILQGVIRGNPNAPALLENVIVKNGSVLSGVRFGKNVIVEDGVILQEYPYLPVLEKILGIDATGKTKTTRSRFYGGISVSGKAYVQKATQLLIEPVSVRGRIIPEPEHIGQKVDLFVYSPYFEISPNLGNNPPHYLADEQGKILFWNQNPVNLIAFKTGVVLESVHELEMFVGHFIATGGLNIVFGYRLEDGTLFMTELQNGIEVTIQ